MGDERDATDYDLVVVGGGIAGAALLYTTARFTDLEKVALVEKEDDVGAINTHRSNNSQTLHFGDIETNYSREKAEKVKEGAEMLAGYLEREDPDRNFHARRSKMVIAAGEDEVDELEERYYDEGFGDLYPKLEDVGRERIADLEPKVVEGRDEDTELRALQTPDGYVVDYGATARSLVADAREEDGVDVYTGTTVEDVADVDDGFEVDTDEGTLTAGATVVCAGPQSLQFAKDMGYGEDKSLLPVAGSFFLGEEFLNGKVYTLQMDELPFAAVHGDADVYDRDVTRFGPSAKVVPTLERGRFSTVSDFLDVFGLDPDAFLSYANILADPVLLPFVLENLVYEVPVVGKRAFVSHVQKVVPTATVDDIERADGYGGVRPQIVDTEEKSLDMGEAKITGDGVVFNITPSPGASTCLKNAMRDTRQVMEFLDGEFEFDENAFRDATRGHFPRPDEETEGADEDDEDLEQAVTQL